MTSIASPSHPYRQEQAAEDDEEELDLGIGTSSGPAFRNGLGAGLNALSGHGNGPSQYSVMALLEDNPIHWTPAKRTTTASDEIPYTPINIKPSDKPPVTASPSTNGTKLVSKSPIPGQPTPSKASPFFPVIDSGVGWLKPYKVGNGLQNVGNTCFLNSALQVLLHTPPLIRYIDQGKHDPATCPHKQKTSYCVMCALVYCKKKSFEQNSSYTPGNFTNFFKAYAPGLRVGRQEDAHEFLRLVIDGMQTSALCGTSPKLDQRIKDSTFVHQIFGGRLRSRVACSSCHHNSDTFDSILDLSLDIQNCDSIIRALDKFTKVDKLQGQNKYKCEKCKKLVNAEKSFSIEEAPLVLTVHLKRFTPTGRKITDTVKYPEQLSLKNYMADSSQDPHYRLYGVVDHSGGGRNSGHYTAFVKAGTGKWYSMNDNFVSPESRTPINSRNAYMLFYIRDHGDLLNEAIYGGGGAKNGNGSGMQNGAGKRLREANGSPVHEDTPSAFKKPFIGPRIPSPNSNGHPISNGNGPRPPQVLSSSTLAAPSSSYDNAQRGSTPTAAFYGGGGDRGNGKKLQISGVGAFGKGVVSGMKKKQSGYRPHMLKG